MKNYQTENSRAEKLYPSERTNDNFCKGDCPRIPFPLPPILPGPPSVYSRSGISGTGTTGSVAKMRLPGSISRTTALNSPSPTASQRTDPVKSDVSAAGNAWSMSQDVAHHRPFQVLARLSGGKISPGATDRRGV